MSRNRAQSELEAPPEVRGLVGVEAQAPPVRPLAALPRAEARAEAARPKARRRRRSVWPLLLLLAVLAGGGYGGWWWWTHREAETTTSRATCVVQRADLPIVIAQNGSLEALHAEVIKSRVEGNATIISLVDEGTVITDEDVKNGKILVELDSSGIREQLEQQKITFASAKATYEDSKAAYDIQKSESESKIKQGELNVKFGRMDLEQYVGQSLAEEALAGKTDLLKLAHELYGRAREHRQTVETQVAAALALVSQALAAAEKEAAAPPPAQAGPGKGGPPEPEAAPRAEAASGPAAASMADPPPADEVLGGTALQKKRTLEADIGLAIEEFKRAADKLIWTAKLQKKGFVSANELEADQLALKRQEITLDQALTARELFLRYELPKQAEQLLSLYNETGRELGRIEARSRSALAQAEVKLKSAESTFLLQKTRLEKLEEQLGFCITRATHPGLVVYATSGQSWRYRGSPIEVGGSVHERQEIIKLPDISSLAVNVRVHESVVDKVKEALPARVRIDAFPNLKLEGKVLRVGILPSSANWMNPDLKEYETMITINGVHAMLKPGMSAEVEIQVKTLKDVLQVPVQAVTARGGKTVVYLVGAEGVEEPRDVELGEANDKFVEVRSGLEGGETILLEAPQFAPAEKDEKAGKEEQDKGSVEGEPPPGPEGTPRKARPDGQGQGPGKGDRGTKGGKERRKPPGKDGQAPAGSAS